MLNTGCVLDLTSRLVAIIYGSHADGVDREVIDLLLRHVNVNDR